MEGWQNIVEVCWSEGNYSGVGGGTAGSLDSWPGRRRDGWVDKAVV